MTKEVIKYDFSIFKRLHSSFETIHSTYVSVTLALV